MNYLLAHDLGTSGDKVTLFSEDGALIAENIKSYQTNYSNTLWAEQNPDDWWKAVCAGTKSILKNINPSDVAVVSFSGHMMGCLCVDKNGIPLKNSIIWSDQRAQKEFSDIKKNLSEDEIYKITGHRGSASYSLPKLMWIKNNEPDIYDKTHKVLQCKDYIVLKLTGKFFTEPSDGVGTLAMDIVNRSWSERMLYTADVSKEKLPDVVKSTDVVGTVTKQASRATGLLEGTPIVMGGGDGVVGAIGTGAVKCGNTYMNLGSSAWISTVSKSPIFDAKRRNTNAAHIVEGLVLTEGAMQSAGGAYGWAKNILCDKEIAQAKTAGKNIYELINDLIAQSPPGANGVVFLPYLLGERCPRWNPDAKGAFLGLKMENSRADMIRAVMEGVTYNLTDIIEVFRENGLSINEIVLIGGGAKGLIWRQMLADSMGVTIRVPAMLEGATSLGAAITGAVGVGIYQNFEDATERFVTIKDEHKPNAELTAIYAKRREVFNECYDAIEKVYKKMS